jgi:hypothetical protein
MWMRLSCLIALLLLGACSDRCVSTILASTSSPDGGHEAVRFQRDCGATTGFSTQISILAAGDRPSATANAFVADDDHGASETTAGEGPWVEAEWLGRDTLLIRYDATSRVFKQEATVDGVTIRYEPVVS